jgi:FMN phosphatase YigB (HAD superfamily)
MKSKPPRWIVACAAFHVISAATDTTNIFSAKGNQHASSCSAAAYFNSFVRPTSRSQAVVRSSVEDAKPPKKQIGLLSFDLDDTLFHTGRVVADANQVMLEHMRRQVEQQQPSTGWKMDRLTVTSFLEITRHVRASLLPHQTPIRYRDLRKLAIRAALHQRAPAVPSDTSWITDELVQECYEVWEQERHIAAQRHLFPDTTETLAMVRARYPDLCVAAITNGSGNPLAPVPANSSLAPYFDFRVSGEDDSVFPHRKPHAGIYQRTWEIYQDLFPHHHHHSNNDNNELRNGKSIDKYYSGGQEGALNLPQSLSNNRIWVHVGDCLANDVGASAACGAYAIWLQDGSSLSLSTSALSNSAAGLHMLEQSSKPLQKSEPYYSTATPKDIDERSKRAESGKSSIAVRIESISQLPSALDQLLHDS